MAEPEWLKDINPDDYLKEDFDRKGKGKYTVPGIENDDPEWPDRAAKKVNAAEGDDYVKPDCGLTTANQLNWMPRDTFDELTFVDENNQSLWYSRPTDPNYKMKAKRVPAQVGNTMGQIHPDVRDVIPGAKKVAHALRTKKDGHDDVYIPAPTGNLKELVLRYYKRVEDEEGNYCGIHEWAQDLYPFAKYLCETTGQKLVADLDATTGAIYRCNSDSNANTGTPRKVEAEKMEEKSKVERRPDANTGASEH